MSTTPLTDRQLLAAELLGRGMFMRLVAERVGVSPKTIRRWKDIGAFEVAVERARADAVDPTIESTLRSALQAAKRDGTPDWQTRVAAARTLAHLGRTGEGSEPRDEDELQAPRTIIYAQAPTPAD